MHVDVYTGYNISEAVAAGGGGVGGHMPPGAGRGGDVILKKILSCLTKINKFDEERADKLMMSCRYVIVVTAIIVT